MGTNGILSAMRTTMTGLGINMKKMEVTSENIANVEKSPDEKGNVYQKKIVDFGSQNRHKRSAFTDTLKMKLSRTNSSHIQPGQSGSQFGKHGDEFKVTEQDGEKMVYNPDHPQANEQGYVKMPDINLIEEMVDLISASRSYEANVTVMNAAKQMAKKALEI